MTRTRQIFHVLVISIATLFIAYSITWTLSKIPILSPITDSVLDFEFTDQVFRDRDYSNIPLDTNVYIVNVGEHSRYQLAGMIDSINQYAPAVICMNVIFRNRKQAFVDSLLENSFSKVENLVFVAGFLDNKLSTSHESFIHNGQIGSGSLVLGINNCIRDFNTRSFYQDEEYLHLGLSATQKYAPEITNKFLARMNQSESINYIGGLQKYQIIDFDKQGYPSIYKSDSLGYLSLEPTINLSKIKGKIVLFGFITEDIKEFDPFIIDPLDAFLTPLPHMLNWFEGSNIPNTKGVIIQANIISTILNGNYIESNSLLNYGINIIVVILSTLLLYKLSISLAKHYGLVSKVIALLIILLLIFLTLFIFSNFNYKYDPRWAILVLLFLPDTAEAYNQYIIKI